MDRSRARPSIAVLQRRREFQSDYLHDCRVECRTNAVPVSSSLACMRTWEPTAMGFSASASAPDALMLSTRPRIILLLGSLSFPCDSFTGQQMRIRSATLVSPVPSGFGVAAVSFRGPVQEGLMGFGLGLARRYVRRN